MPTYRLTLALFLLLTTAMQANAQDDWLNKLSKAATKEAGKKGAEKIEALDSVDFQFAISVNENAGFFDVEQKGETGSRLLYSLKEDADKSIVEIARDSLKDGVALYEIRRYGLAEEWITNTKLFLEEKNLTNELVYLRTISNLGLIYLTQGKTVEADQYISNSLKSSEEALGKNSAAYIANLNNLAKLHQALGKYNEAEKEFSEALTLSKDVFGGGMQEAILLNNKAMLFQTIGRYEEAATLMKEAMNASTTAPKKALQGKKSFDNRKFQANLAFIYQLSGKYNEAETTFLEIKKVFDNRKQTGNAEYAGLLNQLGILYIQMNKVDQVEALFKKSQDVYRKRYTEQNISFAKVTNDLGNFYRSSARYADAEIQLSKALSVREKLLGSSHPDYARSQEDMAILYWKTARLHQAYTLYHDVMDKTLSFINSYFPPMSEAEKTSYWDITAPRFQRFYNFAAEALATKPELANDLYDYHIATKALLLNTSNKIKQSILASGNKELISDYVAWLDAKETLARYYTLSKEELQKQTIDLKAKEAQANTMERLLSERSSDFSSGYSSQKVSYANIRDVLKDNEAVVEIIRIHTFAQNFEEDSKYLALILVKGKTSPVVVLLENGKQLESRYSKFYRNAIQQKQSDDVSHEQYWAKLEPALAGKKIVYLSVDGVYNQLNLNSLKNATGTYVVNRYDLVLLGNSKDLLTIKSRKPSALRKNAMLLGFPDYGGNALAALPGTKLELDGISKMLKTSGYQVAQFTQKEASEKNIKNIKGSALVHIATHGYFLKDVESGGNAFGVNAENAANNPLLRSGLLLAGASKTITGETSPNIENNDNGVLTAYEAMNLNLEGTDLIVLSACETGLGDVKNGEGVYGLQRAFLVAGADALIMSLWKVDDAATQLLMTNFYTNWIKLRDKQKAFKQAQLQLMAKYKEPYYWAAFVMIGM